METTPKTPLSAATPSAVTHLVTAAMASMFLRMLEDGGSYCSTLLRRGSELTNAMVADLIQPEAEEFLRIRSDLVDDVVCEVARAES